MEAADASAVVTLPAWLKVFFLPVSKAFAYCAKIDA